MSPQEQAVCIGMDAIGLPFASTPPAPSKPYQETVMADEVNLIVTRAGERIPNQRFGVRLFKDACGGDRYRVAWAGGQWHVYHCGRLITDGPRDSVSSIINYIAAVRGRLA